MSRIYPVSSDQTLYIRTDEISYQDLKDQIQEHFRGVDEELLYLSAEKIQEDCFGYDLYDPADYGNYIVVRKYN